MKTCRGTEHHSAKLDEDKVRALRHARDNETPRPTFEVLGRRFGISTYGAWMVCNRRSWKHVR